MLKRFFAFIAFGFLSFLGILQAQEIGKWRSYLNYTRSVDLDKVGNEIFLATSNTVFIYNLLDNSIERLNKVNALSDVDIVFLRAHPDRELIIIGYRNGNIDLIKDRSIKNITDIKNSTVIGEKFIRDAAFFGSTAYLATGVGVLEFDLDREEFRDTYTINATGSISVNELTIYENKLYAAANDGLYFGDLNSDLSIFSNWIQDLSNPDPFGIARNCASDENGLYVNFPEAPTPGVYLLRPDNSWIIVNGSADVNELRSTPSGMVVSTGYFYELKSDEGIVGEIGGFEYGNEGADVAALTTDPDGILWIADRTLGLIKLTDIDEIEIIAPDGPATNRAFDIAYDNERLWIATGGAARPGGWNNALFLSGFYTYSQGEWKNFTPESHPELLENNFFDAVKIYPSPNDENKVFVGSFFGGFLEVEDLEIKGIIDETNSSLQLQPEYTTDVWVGVAGFAIDEQDNLWVSNSRAADSPIAKRSPDGTWTSYSLSSAVAGNNRTTLDMIVDDNNQKWVILNSGGVAVFNENENGQLDIRQMTSSPGSGGLPVNEVYAFAKDLDGEIWLGTGDGIAVFYSPFDALTDNFSDARQILVEQGGIFQFLLEGQAVSAIAIDGANRKWVGTFGSGVFLLSEDGTEEIRRFTFDNSPLISNNINDIAIDPKSGEVFIATQEGLVSFMSDATEGLATNECSQVYPNPVRETYTGPISISGLLRDSDIRITDIRGNLIYETVSNGGKAVWDGKNLDGQRVATGVYFALASDAEGSSTCVSKILVIK